jgi:SpoVK/Ycf46/Vps4 family AAA+-type ATPase
MTTNRIHQALKVIPGNRFLILYGDGLGDRFVAEDSQLIDIETALLYELKSRGYHRIAYLSPHQPVYFLDEESRALASPGGLYDRAPSSTQGMRILKDGPLSNRFLLPVQTHPSRGAVANSIGDVHALRWLDAIMSDDNGPKSAVIFSQAESALQFFEDHRTLSGLTGSWSRLPLHNQNLCILLFSVSSVERLAEVVINLPVPEIRDAVLTSMDSTHREGAVARISMPEADELERLLIREKAQSSLVVAEPAASLARWLASENTSIRQWTSRLNTIDRIDKATARRMGWISASLNPETSAEQRLADLVGLHRVKQHISEMTAWLYLQVHRSQPLEPPLLHLVFTGNPGTGKTTVARLIGELYRDIGLLKRGHLVEARAADLVSGYVGGTASRTDQVIDQALDGVLFIDEAYVLTEPERGGFGQEALDTLLSRMENDRGRLVVIVAGYPEKMRHFMQSNPGLARRFPIENHYDFLDFTPDELAQILFCFFSDRSIPIPEELRSQFMEIIKGLYDTRDDTFGNAGEMRNLCEAVDRRRAARIMQNNEPYDSPLQPDDIPGKYRAYLAPPPPDLDRLLADMDRLVGLSVVKLSIRRLAHRLELELIRGQQINERPYLPHLQHMIFAGNPGTGKTTVARFVGRIYHALGLLKRGHVVEVARADLVAGYVGQTALKTMDRVKAAVDGVLFIDEAYSLVGNPTGDFGYEVIDTLVKAMEDYRGRLVVIAAGYPQEMEDFLSSNPGLRSRFSRPLEFPDYARDELGEILLQLAQRDAFTLTNDVLALVLDHLDFLRKADGPSFGNARTAQTLFEYMKDALAERVLSDRSAVFTSDQLNTFVLDDVPVPAGILPVPELRFDPQPMSADHKRRSYVPKRSLGQE